MLVLQLHLKQKISLKVFIFNKFKKKFKFIIFKEKLFINKVYAIILQQIQNSVDHSTCVTIILTKNKIISANAGDSRAVKGRYINGKWIKS